MAVGLFAGAFAVPATAAGPRVLPDVPVTGLDERLQLGHNSPALLSDPTDADFVVLANRLDNPDFGCTLHLSGDGGRRWIPVNPVPELPQGAEKCYAPDIAFDADGLLYYLFVGLAGQGNSPTGAYLVTSDDRGRSFSTPRELLGPERYMVRMALDREMGERGRLHLVWMAPGADPPLGGLPPPPNPLMTAWSDDGGTSFSDPVTISDPSRRVVAPALALGPDHSVHVLYYDLEDDARDYQGLEGPTWTGTWSLHLVRSTDGGTTFSSLVTVDEDLVPPERVMLIYTMPPPALAVDVSGAIYAAWHDARNGDWDVFLRRSTDGGRSWAPPLRMNDDRVGNGRHQYLPAVSTAPPDRVDVVFLDRRDDSENVLNNTFLASAPHWKAGFGANVQLTSEPSNSTIGTRYDVPSAIGLVEFGSRLSVLSLPDRTLAAWPDTRNAELGEYSQDVFATEVAFEDGSDDGLAPGVVIGVAGAGAAVVAIAATLLARWRLVRRRSATPAA